MTDTEKKRELESTIDLTSAQLDECITAMWGMIEDFNFNDDVGYFMKVFTPLLAHATTLTCNLRGAIAGDITDAYADELRALVMEHDRVKAITSSVKMEVHTA